MPVLNINECPRSTESNGNQYAFVNPNADYSHKTKNYHAGSLNIVRRGKRLHPSHRFAFGFEAEKIDNIALGGCDVAALEAMGFRIEKDASLTGPDGVTPSKAAFEFVSPIYELEFMQRFRNDMVMPEIKRMIDADHTVKCGGHMALSATGLSASEVFEGVAGFFPLLYAMYPNRINNSYCRAKSKAVMTTAPEKRSAVFVKSGYIEFRIFPAIKNTRNLLWRAELLGIMAENFGASEKEVFMMMIDKKSSLHKHLRKIFTAATIASKAWDFAKYAKTYNHAVIEPLRIKGAERTLTNLSREVAAAPVADDQQ